jgi:hypothetical protein
MKAAEPLGMQRVSSSSARSTCRTAQNSETHSVMESRGIFDGHKMLSTVFIQFLSIRQRWRGAPLDRNPLASQTTEGLIM